MKYALFASVQTWERGFVFTFKPINSLLSYETHRTQAERAGKDDLEEETLRLRAELLRQQRSYWQATATLNNRYAYC